MQILKKFFSFIFNVYAAITLILVFFILFPLVLFSMFFSPKRRSDYIYNTCRIGFDVLFVLWGINHKNIFEAEHDSSKPVIFVFNHISYIDAMVILKAVRNQSIRGLGKAEIAKIPLLGFVYKNAVIMVKRDDAEDRARSVADLKAAINDNISIILAPEGTFNMTTKPLTRFYDGAFRIAIQTQTPIKPLLFLDTYDRLNYNSLFSVKPGKSRVVFLDEVSVEGYTIDDVAVLRQKVYDIMEAALIRYNASWIKE
ncbi:MAG: lysophospholipid acyltransferase family protein [Sphingobacteriales bacterium]|nr:lysophospholipid acyltransferase family protein [Sphingobacteriales bacterium]